MLNRKLYARIYRDNPGDPFHPIYVGDHYVRTGGLPERRFRLYGALCAFGSFAALVAAGLVRSVPGRALYSALPYGVAFLPAVLGLLAFLQAPGKPEPVREDTWHSVFVRIQACAACGLILTALSLLGGIVACILAGEFGGGDAVCLAGTAAAGVLFALQHRLRRQQTYEKRARTEEPA